jgi:hypothetical protein
MEVCTACETPRSDGYHVNPVTGQPTPDFWCTECYEATVARATRERFRPDPRDTIHVN